MKKEIYMTFVVLVSIFIFMAVTFAGFKYLFPFKYKDEIVASCSEFKIEEGLVASIIFAESRFNKNAKSSKGAVGLMQLMPSTAKSFYVGNFEEKVLLEPKQNIKLGVSFLNYLFRKYQDEITVLACYNAGEKIVNVWMGGEEKLKKSQIKYKETLNYVEKVQKYKKLYKIYF